MEHGAAERSARSPADAVGERRNFAASPGRRRVFAADAIRLLRRSFKRADARQFSKVARTVVSNFYPAPSHSIRGRVVRADAAKTASFNASPSGKQEHNETGERERA